jgi:hypothetical protein
MMYQNAVRETKRRTMIPSYGLSHTDARTTDMLSKTSPSEPGSGR